MDNMVLQFCLLAFRAKTIYKRANHVGELEEECYVKYSLLVLCGRGGEINWEQRNKGDDKNKGENLSHLGH